MKTPSLFLATAIASSGIGTANAVLPPGYEDDMWCPPNNCRFYTNPFGFVGAESSFNKCNNVAIGEITEGVWTGSLTNTTAPEGWIEPRECTMEEYSECNTNSDCSAVIRSKGPSGGECACYASGFFPVDECEGAASSECESLTCGGDECQYYVAECIASSDGITGNACMISMMEGTYTTDGDGNTIRVTDAPSSSPMLTDGGGANGTNLDMTIPCTSDEDCYTTIRSQAPMDETGVSLCGCYANSETFPFDECEGKFDECRIAKCMGDACEGLEAYCMLNEDARGYCNTRDTNGTASTDDGDVIFCPQVYDPVCGCDGMTYGNSCEAGVAGATVCSQGECTASITDPMTTPGPVNYTWSGGLCNSDEDCYPKIRERVPGLSEIIGVNTCECYANSNNDPLDECQGESDMTCPIAGCMENSCQDARAYCSADVGVCALDTVGSTATPANIVSTRPSVSLPTSATDGTALDMQIPCSTDDECFIVQRFQAPDRDHTGVSICGCYSNSVTFPFDECEGTGMGCMMATCMTGGCDGLEAYCMLDEDANGYCNILETSEPSITTATGTGPTEYTWSGGICTTDDDCFAANRQRTPSLTETIGVGTCECYANSYFDPLDECQGESDETCSISKCAENPCDGARAYCSLEELVCLLDTATTNDTVVEPSVTTTTPSTVNYTWEGARCSSDDECYSTMREKIPGTVEVIGVAVCQCYAASDLAPLDECQGDTICSTALCVDNPCGNFGAYCDVEEGLCALDGSDALAVPSSPPAANYTWSGGLCNSDEDCYPKIREFAPGTTEMIGAPGCSCYANSYNDPLDECQADELCEAVDCLSNAACDDASAYCSTEKGICLLLPPANNTEQITTNSSTPASNSSAGLFGVTTETPSVGNYSWNGGVCSTDDDCYPKIRERVPALVDTIGVNTCQCYAASYQDPLDECQGESDMTCPIADCMGSPCGDSTAHCDQDAGVCMLSTFAGSGQHTSTNVTGAAVNVNVTNNATVDSVDLSTTPASVTGNTTSTITAAPDEAFVNETSEGSSTDASFNATDETTANETISPSENTTDTSSYATVETASNGITFAGAQDEATTSIIDKVHEDLRSGVLTKKCMTFLIVGLSIVNWMLI